MDFDVSTNSWFIVSLLCVTGSRHLTVVLCIVVMAKNRMCKMFVIVRSVRIDLLPADWNKYIK